MLCDQQRMMAYEKAISSLVKGKVVIDVGAGTGVLSCMAARAGASVVYALEKCDIAIEAEKIFAKNDECRVVKLMRGLAENFEMGETKADVIISEWMGYLLLYENMLPSVLKVRDRCLAAGGLMIPRKASIMVSAISRPVVLGGVDLSQLRPPGEDSVEISVCPFEWICTDSHSILFLNLEKDSWEGNTFEGPFKLTAKRNTVIHGMVAWFVVELADGISLSTSQADEPTHWKQAIFNFKDPFTVSFMETV